LRPGEPMNYFFFCMIISLKLFPFLRVSTGVIAPSQLVKDPTLSSSSVTFFPSSTLTVVD
jgi:hypothetical protein